MHVCVRVRVHEHAVCHVVYVYVNVAMSPVHVGLHVYMLEWQWYDTLMSVLCVSMLHAWVVGCPLDHVDVE